MIFWESDLNFVTVLLDAINLGHLLLQKPNGAGDRRVHAATMHLSMNFFPSHVPCLVKPRGSHRGFPRHWLLARDVDSCRRGPILYQEICSRVLKDNSDPAIFHLVVNNKISCTSTNLACNYLLDILRFFNPPLSCFPRWKWLSGLGGTWTSTKKRHIRSFEHLEHVTQK